ncbi:tetratricopeptide repeat-containing sensor histidine kinase [Flavobacterium ammonificans]|uniref:tetratricopeptide repeat-containing sensor histidine kinase n=1 Tax=Flavobacterium ammonificans TaxID=1751056 RepID=UPI001E3D5DF9|nr:sensor histidine kinase [Flavobacterium ammonificans]BDB57152.1 two-component sensor histidine kinase [Flavobacterium ammonificans]
MKKLINLILFILFFSCSKRENNSLSTTIFQTPQYIAFDVDKKITFLDSLNNSIIELPQTVSSVNYLFDLSTEYYYLNQNFKSLDVSRKALLISNSLHDTLSIAKSYNYIGDAYEQDHKDSAFYYYRKAEKLYQILGNDELIGKMLFNKGYILFYEGNYTESEIEFSNSLQFLKYSSNHELLYTVYNMMGCTLERLDDNENALKYFGYAKNELKLLKTSNTFKYKLTLSVNIANVYDKRNEFDKSVKELNSVLNDGIAKKWPSDYANVLGNLGYSKMKSGDLKNAKPLLLKAYNISLKNDTESNVLYKIINLAEYYLKVKDTTKSRDYLNRALVLENKIKASNELKLVYDLLSKAEPQRDSYYKGKIIRLTDSLAVVQRKNRNKYARIEYETAVVEDANKELSSKNLYLIFGVVVLVAALGVRYVIGQRKEIAYRKQLQAAELELFDLMRSSQVALNSAREEEQNRISRELHDNVMNKLYGTRLQLGMLNSPSIPDVEVKRLEQIDVLQTIEQDIRAISHDLHTDVVASHFDYPVLLAQCVQQLSATTQTNLHLDCAAGIDWEAVSGLVKITLYRMVQEALSNVVKYAAATDCHITIGQADASSLLLTVSDTGKGFDLATASSGIGLKNMRDRARLVKADFRIESAVGQGTRIECKFVI